MAKQQYVRGSYLLEENVNDTKAYYEQHKEKIDSIIKWADDLHIYVGFGVSEDRTYLCEYEVVGSTKQMCNGVAAELKAMLKAEWKKLSLGYQTKGFKF